MSDNIEFREPTIDEIKQFYGGISYPGLNEGLALFVNGKMVGMAGIIRDPSHWGTLFEENGKKIGFIDADPEAKLAGYRAVLAIKDYMKTKCDELYVQCDVNNYASAPRLLAALGFKETDEISKDSRNTSRTMRIWKWQRC